MWRKQSHFFYQCHKTFGIHLSMTVGEKVFKCHDTRYGLDFSQTMMGKRNGLLIASYILRWCHNNPSFQWIPAEQRVCSLAEGETSSLEDPSSLFLDLQSCRVPPSSSLHLCDSAPASLPLLLWRGRICRGVGVLVYMSMVAIPWVITYVLMGGVEMVQSSAFYWASYRQVHAQPRCQK